jgi:hypothetical protein
MELAKVRMAVEMTAQCSEVDYEWRAPEDRRWHARLWCNAVGQHVLGYGPDAWTAVQAAHAERARYTTSPHLFPY